MKCRLFLLQQKHKNMEKKKFIDLSKVKVQQVNGEFIEVDYSKDVAAAAYNNTQDIETATACIDLFKTGKCEYSDSIREQLINTVNNLGFVQNGQHIPLGIVFKKAILEAIG